MKRRHYLRVRIDTNVAGWIGTHSKRFGPRAVAWYNAKYPPVDFFDTPDVQPINWWHDEIVEERQAYH